MACFCLFPGLCAGTADGRATEVVLRAAEDEEQDQACLWRSGEGMTCMLVSV